MADQGDEEAIYSIIDEMLGMCANAGQETLISRNSESFLDWGMIALEAEGGFGGFDDMLSFLDVQWEDHSLPGTIEIWQYGFEGLVGQSSFHDSTDEEGEGTGDNVNPGADF